MRLIDQFQKIHDLLEAKAAQPGLPALAEALHCTERNARLLLRKMEAQGWLSWDAARGRGHFSRLTLLNTPKQVWFDHLSTLLAKGELEEAFASLDSDQRKQLMTRLPDFMGVPEVDGASARLRIPLARTVTELDPIEIKFLTEAYLVHHIFARLLEFDRTTKQLIPALSHHWEDEENGKIWNFWLRRGLTFHDGSPLEAADVQHTLLRLRDSVGEDESHFRNLDSVDISGSWKVTCRLKTGDHFWPHYLATSVASIVPRKRSSDFSFMPIGSGPFRLTRRSDYRLSLSAFENYYKERALLEEIDLWVMSEADEASKFDLHFGPISDLPTGQSQVVQELTTSVQVVCNPCRPFFSSASQRLALADWLAPTELISTQDISQRPAFGYLPAWRHRVATLRTRRPRIPKAVKLKMAAVSIGKNEAILNLIQNRLQAADVQVTVAVLSHEEYLRCDWAESADLVVCGGYSNPDDEMCCHWQFSEEPVFRRWMAKEHRLSIDKKLLAIRECPDAPTRMERYKELDKQFVNEGWTIPISHTISHVRVGAHVGGAKDMTLGYVPLAGLWLR